VIKTMVWSLNVAKQILGNFNTQISKTHIILDITSSIETLK